MSALAWQNRSKRTRHRTAALPDSRQTPPAPFVSSVMRVEDAWIDYNGHLNMAYYNVIFDRAVDELFEAIGLGPDYLNRTGHSTFTAEAHLRYLRELRAGDPVRVTIRLLAHDAKRLHYFEDLHHAEQGWLSATSENMSLHVDTRARRTAPFPADITRRIAAMMEAHAALPSPDGAGRSIAMPEPR
jgi:acyl-CoA thioester hydrolase